MEETPPRPFRRFLPLLALFAALTAYILLGPQIATDSPVTASPSAPAETATRPIVETSTPVPAATLTAPLGEELPILAYDFPNGLIVMSIQENRNANLFLYHPEILPLTRITNGPWDDIHPSLSPDGSQLAFSSDRDGSWDLYSLNLLTGETVRITDFPGYEGSPTWSPDSQFIAYEGYTGGDLDIFILRADGSEDPIRLTDDPAADHSPAWSPAGRQIAFVSTRSGDSDIWTANLQQADNRFTNQSSRPFAEDGYPTWSPDGDSVAWASIENGLRSLMMRSVSGESAPRIVGSGDRPVFSPDGGTLLTVLDAPNSRYLTAYPLGAQGIVSLPPLAVPGSVLGLDWGDIRLARPLPARFSAAAAETPAPLWTAVKQSTASAPAGRGLLVPLAGVDAPDARLLDDVNDSFEALRSYSAGKLGWDLLASLENAYVSITSPLAPGLSSDWLYTGRAFAVTNSPVQAGWIVVVREDFGAQTFWRVYVRARFQDGSQGRPLTALPFDLSARYSGDPSVYEQGGRLMVAIPEGYWIDFTEMALRFNWERQPALINWRTFYQGARINEFVLTGGLDWHSAMLNMYPAEALISPSPITPVTPSPTPTRTSTPTITPSPTITLTPTITKSPIPTQSP